MPSRRWTYDLTCPGCQKSGSIEFDEPGMDVHELSYGFFLKRDGGTVHCGQCGNEADATNGERITHLRLVSAS